MDETFDTLLAVTGAGLDDQDRVVLSVLTKSGRKALVSVTGEAVSHLISILPMAMSAERIRGEA